METDVLSEALDETRPRLSLVVSLVSATAAVWSVVALSVVQAM